MLQLMHRSLCFAAFFVANMTRYQDLKLCKE